MIAEGEVVRPTQSVEILDAVGSFCGKRKCQKADEANESVRWCSLAKFKGGWRQRSGQVPIETENFEVLIVRGGL